MEENEEGKKRLMAMAMAMVMVQFELKSWPPFEYGKRKCQAAQWLLERRDSGASEEEIFWSIFPITR